MLPQNGQQRPPQQPPQGQGFGGFMGGGGGGFDAGPYFNLDASQAAKQMAALNAAKQARMGVNPRASSAGVSSAGGTSSGAYFGGINSSSNYPAQNHDPLSSGPAPHARFQIPNNNGSTSLPNLALNPPLLEPSMSQPANSRGGQQRQQGFLQGLHNLMASRGQPLPPALTGVPVPNYDPSTSPWSAIEFGSEVGTFKVAGKDVNLFRLWGIVFQNGGGQALSNNNAWSLILPHFDLPEEFPSVQANGSNSVATMMSQYYMAILYPFEETYRKSIQENQRKANLANRQAMMGNGPMPGPQPVPQQGAQMQRSGNSTAQGMVGPGPPTNGMPRYPSGMPQQPHSRPPSGVPMPGPDAILPTNHAPDLNLLDQDGQGIKRKLDIGDLESKRARPRTGEPQPGNMAMPSLDRHPSEPPVPASQLPQTATTATQRPRQQPSRRKIEYIPLAREVDTYGGRDLRLIDAEVTHSIARRSLRELNDWGTVDIECLTMSMRSRLGPELSYALTTFTLLSTMRGQTAGSGFPIFQCADLLEETLDLIEDFAFGDDFEASHDSEGFGDVSDVVTNHHLVNCIIDEQSLPFAGLELHQGSKDPALGPQQRPASYVLAALNIIRNLSSIPDNVEFLAGYARLLDVILRVCGIVVKDGVIKPVSLTLSLNDLVIVRKDTLYTLSALAGFTTLSTSHAFLETSLRITRRMFQLASSYLIDPIEAVAPVYAIQQAGVALTANTKAPTLADVALEVFNRFSQPDHNRKLLIKAVPQRSLWTLFECLVHRLPVSELDFQLAGRESWLCYLEKTIMAIYSLAFMAPPDLKEKMRTDKVLRFKSVIARLLHRFLNISHEGRLYFLVCARRATEALKVLDDALDPFDNPVDSTAPTLSFGMGFADAADSGQEKGTGLLGGHKDLAWDMLMFREVQNDEVMFSELESLVRVEYQ